MRTLYGSRQTHATHLQPITDYFWLRAYTAPSEDLRTAQETYLLATLSPLVRSTGCQKILPDARLRKLHYTASREELEGLLTARAAVGESSELTLRQFHDDSRKLLIPDFTTEERAAYQELCGYLFGEEVLNTLATDSIHKAQDAVVSRWQDLDRWVGRRSDSSALAIARRSALDVLSYESRAAVRRCYSAVWSDLIPHLVQAQGLSPATERYLRMWHLEPRDADTFQSWFHGHIFALHPALSLLMQTNAGRERVGEYLTASADAETGAYQRLLHTVYRCLYFYTDRRESDQLKRRR